MVGFIVKFISSMIKAQKGRMFIAFIGIFLCSFFVLNFYYYCTTGSMDAEYAYENYFHATFKYDNTDDVELITDELEKVDGITCIELSAWFEDDFEEMIPAEMSDDIYARDGIIIAAYAPQLKYDMTRMDIGRGFTSDETDKIMVTYAGKQLHGASESPGSNVTLWGKNYIVSGYYNHWGCDFILPLSEFLSFCVECDNAQITLKYWYDTTLTYEEVKSVNDRLENIKKSNECMCEEPDIEILWDMVWEDGRIMFFAMIISVLNFMFVYIFILKNRVQQYRILKLLGVSSNKLQMIMFLELLLTYTIAFVCAYIALQIYIRVNGFLEWSLWEICTYSYVSLLGVIVIMFVMFTRGFAKKAPFAAYQEN